MTRSIAFQRLGATFSENSLTEEFVTVVVLAKARLACPMAAEIKVGLVRWMAGYSPHQQMFVK